jgi:DNA processing protein
VTLGDPAYPEPLLQTADPPLLLYAAGRLELLQARSLAIVGSRSPTPQGRERALAFGGELSQAGWTVVSGLALGVDGAAHEGALTGPGGTVAVVGTGLDVVYPKRHAALTARIAREGLLVSEYSLGTPPLAANFPTRNRIIAGLSRGTLVVEAALQSGSLITARLAAEAGREVFAMPGSLNAPQSRGCHALIKQGAKLVETAQDIFDELQGLGTAPARPVPVAEPAVASPDALLAALGFDPVGLDELINRTGCGAAELSARLLALELEGSVVRLPGQLFQRAGRA